MSGQARQWRWNRKASESSGGGGKQGVLCYEWFRLREGLREDTYMYRLYFCVWFCLGWGVEEELDQEGGQSESFEPASEFCTIFIPRATSMSFSLTMYDCT